MTDTQLLRRFVERHDQGAFAELVRRHADLVYSAALRHLGRDFASVEDVTQEVFSALGRKAASLVSHPSLAGWLYSTTRFTALNWIRDAQRRVARERTAEFMPTESREPELAWEQIHPVLDSVLDELEARDRESILLRFFGQRTFRSIGTQLGMSENAAQKRVERALERLNTALARRGITSTAAALTVTLGRAQMPAPAPLIEILSVSAAAGTYAATGISTVSTSLATWALGTVVLVAVGATLVASSRIERNTEPKPAAAVSHLARTPLSPAAEATRQISTSSPRITNTNGTFTRATTEAERVSALPPQRMYQVRRGDTVSLVARIWNVSTDELLASNPLYDFSLMAIGDQLVIPSHGRLTVEPSEEGDLPNEPSAQSDWKGTYLIVAGDTPAAIAAKNNLTLAQLRALNPEVDWARLRVGLLLHVQRD